MQATAELFDTIRTGDVKRLKELLTKDPSLASAKNEAGITALLQARYQFRMDMVDALLAANPQLDIFEASALGKPGHLAELLDQSPDLVSAWSPDGFTPLHLASFFGHPQTVELLLKRGAEVNAVSRNSMSVMPLHSALARRQRAIVEMLLARGAQVNARQQGGWTPLHEAAHNADGELARLLLNNAADPNLASDDGKTALDLAAAEGHEEVSNLIRQASGRK